MAKFTAITKTPPFLKNQFFYYEFTVTVIRLIDILTCADSRISHKALLTKGKIKFLMVLCNGKHYVTNFRFTTQGWYQAKYCKKLLVVE